MNIRDLTSEDASELTQLYEDYGWWDDRETEEVHDALEETEVAVGIEVEGELVASARVLTDYTYYANVFDVIVSSDHRNEDIGKVLMQEVVDHPDLQSVNGISLLCRRSLVSFYESVGFELFDPEIEIPEGGTEEMVRMTYDQEKN